MTQVVAMGETPGPLWSDVAASAYRAYVANRGEGLPPWDQWDQLPPANRTAWEAAVRQVGEILGGGSFGLDTEQKWAGWVPPQPDGVT